ncbi:MAG: tRNA lysidine(34) synthetase TilS [Burkholderiales bacterium]|nr:tRNA lysidine(34) synthetase TilS [Burkholderiales bacterium]
MLEPARAALSGLVLRGARLAAAISGGVDSTVLVHALARLAPEFGYRLRAVHVHHGLSPHADDWRRACARLCRSLGVPFTAYRVAIGRSRRGLEAEAREQRRAVFARVRADAIALGHQLDDQAETVLLNLLRGAGPDGAAAMPSVGRLGSKLLVRPLLAVPREAIVAYARAHALAWVEDESNADEARTRNFLRRRVGPLLAERFPRWRENLARAARHFADAQLDARLLLREFLAAHGLRAPSEAKLAEMLRQLAGAGSRAEIRHDGAIVRRYRDRVTVERDPPPPAPFAPVRWQGEARLALPALGGELRFRRVRGTGIAAQRVREGLTVRLRAGGERLRPDPRRPRRTLKNLFQEAGVPPWQRARLPLLFCGADLVWVPGLGVDAAYASAPDEPGIVPEWRPFAS